MKNFKLLILVLTMTLLIGSISVNATSLVDSTITAEAILDEYVVKTYVFDDGSEINFAVVPESVAIELYRSSHDYTKSGTFSSSASVSFECVSGGGSYYRSELSNTGENGFYVTAIINGISVDDHEILQSGEVYVTYGTNSDGGDIICDLELVMTAVASPCSYEFYADQW